MNNIISYVQISLSIITTFVILFLYKRKKLDVVGALLWAFATRTFSIDAIGPTIDPLFLISFYLVFEEIFVYGKIPKLKAIYVILFVLPIFTYLFIFIYNYYANFFVIRNGYYFKYITRPLYYYIKTYIIFFILAVKIYRTYSNYKIEQIFNLIKKITTFSIIIAVIQLLSKLTINNEIINSMLGLNNGGTKYAYNFFGLNLVRIQAFFYEPKGFAAFLGLSLPIFYKEKKYKLSIVIISFGILTLSTTFISFLIVGVISFILTKKIKGVRTQIIGNLVLIIVFFGVLSFVNNIIFNNYLTFNNQTINQIINKRLLNRFDTNSGSNEFLWMPLQGDLELPVLNFLKDNPALIFTGYGPGNNIFIPDNYFWGQDNYNARKKMSIEGHIDMGWYYYIAEFGIIYFIVLFLVLTKLKLTKFEKNYYAFLWGALFFTRIDMIVLIFFVVLVKRKKKINENFVK